MTTHRTALLAGVLLGAVALPSTAVAKAPSARDCKAPSTTDTVANLRATGASCATARKIAAYHWHSSEEATAAVKRGDIVFTTDPATSVTATAWTHQGWLCASSVKITPNPASPDSQDVAGTEQRVKGQQIVGWTILPDPNA